MLKLIKYDLKKHIKVALILSILIVASIITNYIINLNYSYSRNSIIIFTSTNILSMVIDYFMLFSYLIYFIYIGNEYNKSIQSGEKYMYFTLPISTGKLLLSKFLAMLIGGLIILFSYYLGENIIFYLAKFATSTSPESFNIIIPRGILLTMILYAIVFYFIIVDVVLLVKPITKRRSFKYFWVLPAAMVLIIYLGGTFTVFENNFSQIILYENKILPWNLWITLLLSSLILFIFNIWFVRKRLDL